MSFLPRFRRQAPNPNAAPAWMVFLWLGVLGVVMALIYITQVPGDARWSAFGTALAVAGASAVVGGIVGFLFGIPLANPNQGGNQGAGQNAGNGAAGQNAGNGAAGQNAGNAAAGQNAGNAAAGQNAGNGYKANTNLEQVSDWLTKIIVGVGLVQIGHALPALTRLARSLKDPLGGLPSSSAFGLGLTIYFALLGFLFLYLWARTGLLSELNAGLVKMIQQQVGTTVREQVGQTESNRALALQLVNQQLNAGKGGSPPDPVQLNQAIADAPDSTRLLIFNQTEQFRAIQALLIRRDLAGHLRRDLRAAPADVQDATRQENLVLEQGLVALTIPVFQALIAADTQSRYHRNYGSLGWALKDKAGPAAVDGQTWRDAVQALDTAINIRDRLGITGWRLYEANRAVCNINLVEALPPGDPAIADLQASIQQDLLAARDDPRARPMLEPPDRATVDPDIAAWLVVHPLP